MRPLTNPTDSLQLSLTQLQQQRRTILQTLCERVETQETQIKSLLEALSKYAEVSAIKMTECEAEGLVWRDEANRKFMMLNVTSITDEQEFMMQGNVTGVKTGLWAAVGGRLRQEENKLNQNVAKGLSEINQMKQMMIAMRKEIVSYKSQNKRGKISDELQQKNKLSRQLIAEQDPPLGIPIQLNGAGRSNRHDFQQGHSFPNQTVGNAIKPSDDLSSIKPPLGNKLPIAAHTLQPPTGQNCAQISDSIQQPSEVESGAGQSPDWSKLFPFSNPVLPNQQQQSQTDSRGLEVQGHTYKADSQQQIHKTDPPQQIHRADRQQLPKDSGMMQRSVQKSPEHDRKGSHSKILYIRK